MQIPSFFWQMEMKSDLHGGPTGPSWLYRVVLDADWLLVLKASSKVLTDSAW